MILIFWLTVLTYVSSAIGDDGLEKPCEAFLRKISNFPDGYRGYLTLPVMKSVRSWMIKITFTHYVRNFDTAQGDKRVPSRTVEHIEQ